ncbi:MAG: acyltransferase [Acidimicrobiia bacterium]
MTSDSRPTDRWVELPASRIEDEPWWLAYVEDPSPERVAAHAELTARAGYDVHPRSFVALGANVNADTFTLGALSTIASGCKVRGEVSIGELTGLNPGVVTIGKVTIGSRVRIAAYVVLVGENHVFDDPDVPIMDQGLTSEGVVVEDDVWIGANVVVVDGVTVGAHSVIAAGAVVTRDVEPHSVMAGVPARKVSDRRDRAGTVRRDALARFEARIAEQWPAVLERCRISDADPVAYVEFPGADPRDPRPLNDAIEIAGMFSGVPPAADRDELVARIQATQDPVTGLFRDPRLPGRELTLAPSHEEWDMYGLLSCGYALEVLDSGPTHAVHIVDHCAAGQLERLLDGLNFNYLAWPSGSWIDGFATGVYLNRVHHRSTDTASMLWGWLLTHQDQRSGMWGEYLEPIGDADFRWLMAVNGFYRLTRGTYAQFGVEVPRPESAIDTVLAHARDCDWFAVEERNACNLLDVVHPLWLLGRQTDYRRAEIRDAIAPVLAGICGDWIDGEGFAWHIGRDQPGLRGTEMFTAVVHLAADLLGESDGLAFVPRGVHRLAPATTLY